MTSESTSSRPPADELPPAEVEAAAARERARQDALSNLPQRDLPAPPQALLLHGQTPAEGQPVVIIHQLALLQIRGHSQSNLDCELGGALLGVAYRHRGSVIVEVRAALPATSDDHGPVHFTFSADSWSKLHRDRATHYADLDIIGWFHTHPDLGVFYSSDDVVVHSAAFTQPWHVGLVVDPVRQEASFFGWVGHALSPLPGFYELPERQPESQAPWRVVQTAVWDRPYEPEPDPEDPSRVYLARNARPRFSAREVSVAASGLAVLLSFFLVVGGVLPLQRQVKLLETTVLNLAQATLGPSSAESCPDPQLRILTPLPGQMYPAGSSIQVIGTAVYPDARRYQVDLRAAGGELWTLVDRTRSETRLGELAVWDTTGYLPGQYELRLTAVDVNNIRLANSSVCTVGVTLAPAAGQ